MRRGVALLTRLLHTSTRAVYHQGWCPGRLCRIVNVLLVLLSPGIFTAGRYRTKGVAPIERLRGSTRLAPRTHLTLVSDSDPALTDLPNLTSPPAISSVFSPCPADVLCLPSDMWSSAPHIAAGDVVIVWLVSRLSVYFCFTSPLLRN